MGCACAQIVRSLAGHDRGGLFCVLDTDGPYLLLCDGKRRKLENPKRKKAVHTAPAGDFQHPVLDQLRTGGKPNQPRHTEGAGPLSELRN